VDVEGPASHDEEEDEDDDGSLPGEDEEEEPMEHAAAEGFCMMPIGYDSDDEEIPCGEPCNPASQICKNCLNAQKKRLYVL